MSVCTGLVVYKEEYGYLTLVHYTLQEFLERKAAIYFPDAQVDIVRICLTYLSFNEFDDGPCLTDYDFVCRIQKRPLLRYTASNWAIHARGRPEDVCQELILSFLYNDAKLHSSVQILYMRHLMRTGSVGRDAQVRDSEGNNQSRHFPHNVTPLWLASHYGLITTVRHLLINGANTKARTSTGDTALHQVVGSDHDEIVKLLLAGGADPSASDSFQNTPLHLAASPGSCSIASTRIVTIRPKDSEISLNNTEETMLSLLGSDADVNAVNNCGETALHWAVSYNRLSVVQLLLENGADVTIKSRTGLTALTTAIDYNFHGAVQVLL